MLRPRDRIAELPWIDYGRLQRFAAGIGLPNSNINFIISIACKQSVHLTLSLCGI